MRSLTTLLASFVFAAASLWSAAPVQASEHVPAKAAASATRKPAAKGAVATAKAVVLAPVKLLTVRGVVLGPNDLALPGASVFPLGKPGQTVITNQDGEFVLTVPAAQVSALKLNVAYQGLGDWQVRLKDARTGVLFVTLLPKGQ